MVLVAILLNYLRALTYPESSRAWLKRTLHLEWAWLKRTLHLEWAWLKRTLHLEWA